MKQAVLLFLASLLIFPPFAWSQRAAEKPVAALGRVATLGAVKRSQKRIIANRLETILSESYDLISQDQYEKAEEAAFEQLDLDQCTEEECVRKIQELLQVDRLFILQIIAEPGLTQLTLNLMKTDSKRTADAVCENCSTAELYDKIDALARKLVAQDVRESAQEMIAAQPAGPAPAPAAVEQDEGGIAWYWWVLGGVAIAALAAGSSSSSSSDSSAGCQSAECGEVVVNY